MKKIFCVLLMCFAGWLAAQAQVAVEVTMEQQQFLPGESLWVAVRVSNRSGRTLTFGEDADWLTFNAQTHTGGLVSRTGEVPVKGAFTLRSSEVGTKRVNLAPYFALTRPGQYTISANVRIKNWDGVASSTPKEFEIIDGTRIWTQEFGVPPTGAATNEPPEVRRYTLLQANYLRNELRLYFRLSDATDSKVMKVFPLGLIVSFARPDAEVDSQSRLHVLHQNGARTSIYTVITPNGDIAVRELYDYGNVRPRLRAEPDGNISITGGARRSTPGEITQSKHAEPNTPATP